MLKKIVLVFAALALAKAQIPSLGWCPDYLPMPGFDMERFLGIWHEAERYFQITEIVSRCVTSNYTRGPDGKLRVYNEVINRLTGVKRTIEGEIKPAVTKADQGKLHVKYTTVPLAPETDFTVLETDYTSYAVLWGCSGIGPLHAQSAWLLTRERNPAGETLQVAYGVLDKYNIWKRLFVKSDQVACSYEVQTPAPAVAVTAAPVAAPVAAPASVPVKEEPALPNAAPAVKKSFEGIHLRSSSALVQDAEPIDESRKETIEAEAPEELPESIPASNEQPAAENLRLVKPELPEAPTDEIKPQEVPVRAVAPETIPEVILKVAESSKESGEPVASLPAEDPIPLPEESRPVEVAVLHESPPEVFPEAKPLKEAAEPVEVSKKPEIDEVAALPESDEILPNKGADSILAAEESKIEEVAVLPESKPLKEAEEEKLEAAVEEPKAESELAQESSPPEIILPVAELEKNSEVKPEVAAPEEPKANEPAPESIPEEKLALVDAAPAEEPLPIVAATAEEPKPLDALPNPKSPEPVSAILLEDAVEKKDEKIPQASEVVDIEHQLGAGERETPAAFGQVKNEEIIPSEKITEEKLVPENLESVPEVKP